MKKFILLVLLTVCSLGAYAQAEAGRSSFGGTFGYGFDTKNITIGLDYRYSLTDEFRISPSLTYMIKNNDLSAAAIDMNLHYVFNLGNNIAFYPIAGLDLSFWKLGYDSDLKINKTRFGANFGLGIEIYPTDEIVVGFEAKYNIIKDIEFEDVDLVGLDQAMIGLRVAYCF